ncbi:MAG: lipoprotein [Simplicispira sp.]|nr:lipoprotein [Simplicispira sp.]
MLKALQILAKRIALATSVALLCACGQRGPLYLPSDPAATQRATLPQTLTPDTLRTTAPASAPLSAPLSATPPASRTAP